MILVDVIEGFEGEEYLFRSTGPLCYLDALPDSRQPPHFSRTPCTHEGHKPPADINPFTTKTAIADNAAASTSRGEAPGSPARLEGAANWWSVPTGRPHSSAACRSCIVYIYPSASVLGFHLFRIRSKWLPHALRPTKRVLDLSQVVCHALDIYRLYLESII